ncbi:MAG: PEP-CTERM sorting domain-containing protein [Acidobacteriaceae bacterium]|nr:PEP-CTERM sorting domain-containing protein [Acidobacteriaceae bacterium]
MKSRTERNSRFLLNRLAVCTAALLGVHSAALSASFSTPTVFASGAAVHGTGADSVTYGGGSLWVEYGNAAPSTNFSGAGTIVQYSMTGTMQNQYTIAGSVDGLKYNPNTGLVWALQNQDANSQLTIINPATKATSTFTYSAAYTAISGSRGFDDVAFLGNNVYLSLTNPNTASDPVLVKLDNSTPSSPITFSTVLTGNGLLLTDPDSLKSTPTGGLVETGEGDGALTFITNPGQANQTATSLKLVAAPGTTIGNPDDSIYPTASSGTFYLTDTGANVVYALSASGLSSTSLYVDVGDEFGSVNPSTGVITPIMTGQSLHGIEFVAAVPEPSTIGIALCGIALGLFARRRRAR